MGINFTHFLLLYLVKKMNDTLNWKAQLLAKIENRISSHIKFSEV